MKSVMERMFRIIDLYFLLLSYFRVLNQRSKFAFYFETNFRAIFRILNFNALHKRHFSSKRLIEQVLLTICLLMLANKSFPIKGMTLANEHSLTYFNRY